ncbi:O-antigen ligase family protein [Phosphitispora fastidiosa]|uniref:O-antigen ligase family protein n=1 Tax=Phosphitispora fastidiosa TaxID=2837202 RepID=UPI001E61F2DD|nr:hypothetical protein [Phosphitispora fastidiosa]MBU7008197.1 hypothetical protein [Phosphitispora fastidiosa]
MYAQTDKNLYRFFVVVAAFMLVFPKAGDTINGIPLTAANMLLGILILWVISKRVRLEIPITDRVYLLYMSLVLLIPWAFSAGNITAYVKTVMPLFVSLAVYYWVKPVTQALVTNRRRLDILMRVLAVSVIVIVLYGAAQKLFGHYETIIPGITMSFSDAGIPDVFYQKKNLVGLPGFSETVHKVTSTYQNGNLFGAVLVMLMFPITAAFLHARDLNDKIIYGTATVLAFAIIPFTLARSALFGALIGAGMLFLMQRDRRNKIILVFLVLLMFAVTLPSPFMRTRMIMSFFDPSMNGRIERMVTVSSLVSEPVSQAGAEENNNLIEPGKVVSRLFGFGFAGEGAKKVKSFWDLYTENMYFTSYIFTGLAGVLLFAAVVGRSLFVIFQYLRNGLARINILTGLAAGVFCGLAAFLCQAFIEGPLSLPPTGFVFWFLLGLGHSVVNLEFRNSWVVRI